MRLTPATSYMCNYKIEMRVLEIINPQNTGYSETQQNDC